MTEKTESTKTVKEETIKTLTIRLPEALHAEFKEYAKEKKIPMNTLVVNYIKEVVKQ